LAYRSTFEGEFDKFQSSFNILNVSILQTSYMIVDEMHAEHPTLIKDQYWDEIFPAELPYAAGADDGKGKERPDLLGSMVDIPASVTDLTKDEESVGQSPALSRKSSISKLIRSSIRKLSFKNRSFDKSSRSLRSIKAQRSISNDPPSDVDGDEKYSYMPPKRPGSAASGKIYNPLIHDEKHSPLSTKKSNCKGTSPKPMRRGFEENKENVNLLPTLRESKLIFPFCFLEIL
jgi:hypothetical protein